MISNTRLWIIYTLIFLLILFSFSCMYTMRRGSRSELRVDKWKILNTKFFVLKYPENWKVDIKYGNTLYIRPPNRSLGGLMIAVWSAETQREKQEVCLWARKEALSLSPDGKYEPVCLRVDGQLLTGIGFSCKRGSRFFYCRQCKLVLSKEVIDIFIATNDKNYDKIMRNIIETIKIKKEAS